ncbi:hypothetical protein BDV12DRAFT_193115 [Aspergillus spectabilis]
MRPTNPSKPNLPLLYTSLQPHTTNTNTTDYYSSSPPTSPLSSTSTIIGSCPTLPSSPTSPSLSPTLFQQIRPVSNTKFIPSGHSSHYHHIHNLPLRHRPSTIETLLRQERSRATTDSIERQGLDLLEPRPVDLDLDLDLVSGGIEARMYSGTGEMTVLVTDHKRNRLSCDSMQSVTGSADRGLRVRLSQPRFVMGGIEEVMEGRG